MVKNHPTTHRIPPTLCCSIRIFPWADHGLSNAGATQMAVKSGEQDGATSPLAQRGWGTSPWDRGPFHGRSCVVSSCDSIRSPGAATTSRSFESLCLMTLLYCQEVKSGVRIAVTITEAAT